MLGLTDFGNLASDAMLLQLRKLDAMISSSERNKAFAAQIVLTALPWMGIALLICVFAREPTLFMFFGVSALAGLAVGGVTGWQIRPRNLAEAANTL